MARVLRATTLEDRPATRGSRMPHNETLATLAAYSAYDHTSVAALIRYFHVVLWYPVRYTWLKANSAGNYFLWPGLTLANAMKYFLSATATIMWHIVQKRQGVRSTRPNLPTTSSPDKQIPRVRSNELLIQVTLISKFYTNDTGCFPVHSHSVKQYIMITYHCDTNLILAEPFTSRKDKDCLLAYGPGLTLANAMKYFLSATATIMWHIVQKRQGVRSTRPNLPTTSSPDKQIPRVRSNELLIQVTLISKFYTNDTGCFPVHSHSVKQYIMITYHCDTNLILAEPFTSRKDKDCLLAYEKNHATTTWQ